MSSGLQERLGADGTLGLLALLETVRSEWTAEMNEHAALRFERRLTEETAHLRVEVRQGLGDLRLELKQDMNDLRLELQRGMASLETRVERALLHQTRWIVGMWIGQFAATAAMVGAMLQIFRQ